MFHPFVVLFPRKLCHFEHVVVEVPIDVGILRFCRLLRIRQCWAFELLDGFHVVIASLIVLLDIILNTLQRLADLCWVARCSYVEDFVLQLCYFTFLIGFSRLISSVVEPTPVLFSGKFRHLRLLCCHSSDN